MDFNLLTPVTVGFFTAFIMGPVFWVLLETSITKGFRAAVAFDLGVIIADTCFILICYFCLIIVFYGWGGFLWLIKISFNVTECFL